MEERITDAGEEGCKRVCSNSEHKSSSVSGSDDMSSADKELGIQEGMASRSGECEHGEREAESGDTQSSFDEQGDSGDEARWLKSEERGGFVPGKIAPVSESIFSKPGVKRQAKSSLFLSRSIPREASSDGSSRRREAKESHWSKSCRLSYLEDGDCIDVGTGEAHIKNRNFVFVRDLFKVAILNVPCRSIQFRDEKQSVFFKAKGRRSTGESFEIAEREYVMEFHSVEAANEFLSEVKK